MLVWLFLGVGMVTVEEGFRVGVDVVSPRLVTSVRAAKKYFPALA